MMSHAADNAAHDAEPSMGPPEVHSPDVAPMLQEREAELLAHIEGLEACIKPKYLSKVRLIPGVPSVPDQRCLLRLAMLHIVLLGQ